MEAKHAAPRILAMVFLNASETYRNILNQAVDGPYPDILAFIEVAKKPTTIGNCATYSLYFWIGILAPYASSLQTILGNHHNKWRP